MIGNPLKIKELISEMNQGSIRIPEIQRGYVWKRSQIAKLMDSIYRGSLQAQFFFGTQSRKLFSKT